MNILIILIISVILIIDLYMRAHESPKEYSSTNSIKCKNFTCIFKKSDEKKLLTEKIGMSLMLNTLFHRGHFAYLANNNL